ncbi:hypothetical protein GF356_03525 [candidate division GN15 bacterium]|nr:hypothetical protein [candidate division GN15 bacterium]
MSDLVFKRSTDTEHEIKLDSTLVSANWLVPKAPAGLPARFEVTTAFVGNGAKIKVLGTSEKGAKLGQVTGKVRSNRFVGELTVPESAELGDKVYFTVDLSGNGLSGESDRIPVIPPVRVANMRWSSDVARRGEILSMTADASGLPSGSEVEVVVYEYDSDGAHDRIVAIPTQVANNRIEVQWEYEFHEDTDDIPTQEQLDQYDAKYHPPEYFFTVRFNDQEFGTNQESGLLEFKDWIELELADANDNPLANEKYILTLPDGTKREGELDADGHARIEDVPPGPVAITFPRVQEHEIVGEETGDSEADQFIGASAGQSEADVETTETASTQDDNNG